MCWSAAPLHVLELVMAPALTRSRRATQHSLCALNMSWVHCSQSLPGTASSAQHTSKMSVMVS